MLVRSSRFDFGLKPVAASGIGAVVVAARAARRENYMEREGEDLQRGLQQRGVRSVVNACECVSVRTVLGRGRPEEVCEQGT